MSVSLDFIDINMELFYENYYTSNLLHACTVELIDLSYNKYVCEELFQLVFISFCNCI